MERSLVQWWRAQTPEPVCLVKSQLCPLLAVRPGHPLCVLVSSPKLGMMTLPPSAVWRGDWMS